jgi:ribosome-associated protein
MVQLPSSAPRAVVLSESGGQAKQAIAEGLVQVNGAVETRKRKKLAEGDRVSFGGQTIVVKT